MGARLGQHFLTNPHYARILAESAGITPADTVLEIGPGGGMLTKELLAVANKVITVEKDEVLTQKLRSTFADDVARGALVIVGGDIRDMDPAILGLEAGKYVLAANIPYYITGELVRKFLETDVQPRSIAFLIQKEVAQRITSDKESILSVSVKAYGTPKIAAKVTKGNFNPPPSVDSAILVISDISKKNFTELDEKKFFEVVRTGFSAKRKLLAGNLGNKYSKESVTRAFETAGVSSKARAENIQLEKWLAIAAVLTKQ